MRRSRGPGWAAFGQKQNTQAGPETEFTMDPCPATLNIGTFSIANCSTAFSRAQTKPFSSVVCPSVKISCPSGNLSTKHYADQTMQVKMLKDIHAWADQSIIEDVLVAVGNDVDQASSLLQAMLSSETTSDGPNSSTLSNVSNDIEGLSINNISEAKKLAQPYHEVLTPNCLLQVPVEPEWEEDDVYLSHRKEAMKMMRMAAQHSRAASNAFLRGDHISAQQNSSLAHEKRLTAEILNAEAASEILRIQNKNNGIWKIDLHGLHASEAVNALKERLQKIELEFVGKRAVSTITPPFENDMKKRNELSQHKQMILQVITGTGNHSKGQASLPIAIKSFLIENGYRFDDARPGVIGVRPKFRNK